MQFVNDKKQGPLILRFMRKNYINEEVQPITTSMCLYDDLVERGAKRAGYDSLAQRVFSRGIRGLSNA